MSIRPRPCEQDKGMCVICYVTSAISIALSIALLLYAILGW